MKINASILLLALASSATCLKGQDGIAITGPHEPDANTLMLCHFDESMDADFAAGMPFASGSMQLVEGLFGKAADARRGLTNPSHLLRAPFFRMVRYDLDKNFSVAEGTLEMWVNPHYSLAPELLEREAPTGSNSYTLFHMAISPGHRDITLFLREWKDAGMLKRDLIFRERYSIDPKDSHEIRSPVGALPPGRWTHVAVTWSEEGRALFVDGKKVASSARSKPLPAFGPTARPMAIGSMATYSSQPAYALIDEFRISDSVRYKNDFAIRIAAARE